VAAVEILANRCDELDTGWADAGGAERTEGPVLRVACCAFSRKETLDVVTCVYLILIMYLTRRLRTINFRKMSTVHDSGKLVACYVTCPTVEVAQKIAH
jgi:hypothetical protein